MVTQEQELEVVREYAKGESLHELIRKYHVSRKTILRLLRANDVELRPKPYRLIKAKRFQISIDADLYEEFKQFAYKKNRDWYGALRKEARLALKHWITSPECQETQPKIEKASFETQLAQENVPPQSHEGTDNAIDPRWVAGFFDGEGTCCIIVNFYGYGHKGGKHSWQFIPYLSITQKERNLFKNMTPEISIKQKSMTILQSIQKTIGFGKIRSGRSSFGNKEAVFYWGINRRSYVYDFISIVGKYSVLKKKQIELMKEFLELKKDWRHWEGTTLLRAVEIAYEMSKLNDKSHKQTIAKLEDYLKTLHDLEAMRDNNE